MSTDSCDSTVLRAEIDTNVDPRVPFRGAKIVKHDRVGKITIELRADGCLYVDGRKVVLFRSERQMNGQIVKGYELRTEEDGLLVLSASILDFLLYYQEYIPKEWRKRNENGQITVIFFLGTEYRDLTDFLYARGMYYIESQWTEAGYRLDYDWDSYKPFAVCENDPSALAN